MLLTSCIYWIIDPLWNIFNASPRVSMSDSLEIWVIPPYVLKICSLSEHTGILGDVCLVGRGGCDEKAKIIRWNAKTSVEIEEFADHSYKNSSCFEWKGVSLVWQLFLTACSDGSHMVFWQKLRRKWHTSLPLDSALTYRLLSMENADFLTSCDFQMLKQPIKVCRRWFCFVWIFNCGKFNKKTDIK